jgi:hypothetical protein
MNTAQNPVLLAPGESPDLLNVDLDRGSIAMTGGSSKFNNQTAPRPGLLVGTRVAGALMPALPAKNVPIHSSAFIPYSDAQDVIGADYTVDETAAAGPTNRYFGRQRGKGFDLQVSFRLPATERLYPANARGQLNNPAAGFSMKFGADEALDEFFAVAQKGGEGMAPMSWALGVVNTGALFDTDVGGGNNIFGISVATYAKRISNYALCFMWLDTPVFGADRPTCARYRLTNGSTFFGEVAHPTTADGAFPTFAYRAMIVPFFIEPGSNYHIALRLTPDTGSSGTTWTAGTGELAGIAWNNDGIIEWKVAREFDAVQTFTSTNGAGTQILRYKGPLDSLEYFAKYGVRHHGRDAVHVGLGFHYLPWQAGGFLPYGVDSCPTEYGGFQINDHSVHGGGLTSAMYLEYAAPEKEPIGAGQITTLRIEHDPAVDAGGTKFGVVYRGLVNFPGTPGLEWGNEAAVWANIDPVFGKHPEAYNLPWAGLGGLLTTGFNPEALKGYRVVFLQDSTAGAAGFTQNTACGGLMSIDTYTNGVLGTYTYAQYLTMEGGDQFNGANPTLVPANFRWQIAIRAFRWNQRPVVVSDLRMYSKARTWDVRADFSLTHELDSARTGDPGLTDLRGHWPLTDGGGYECKENVFGNSAFLMPMAGQRADAGGVFLSGYGEALYLNLAENQDFRDQLRASQGNGSTGFAIQITVRLPEASYALAQRVNDNLGAGGAASYYKGKFASVLAVLDVEIPDRASDLLAPEGGVISVNQFDHTGGALSPPQPLLEFGHNVFVENAIGTEPFAYPMGFSLRGPVANTTDYNNTTLSVPGTGATGIHAWSRPAGTNVPRWDKLAGWAGKDITLQFGFHPTGTVDSFIGYISAWPKEFLNPSAGDPSGAEFTYFSSATPLTRRQIERAIVVIGGSWNPRITTQRAVGPPAFWATLGRTTRECSARMIVKDVRVFATAAPGALPASNGAVVTAGTGKIIGDNALKTGPLSAADIVYPVASGNTPVNFVEQSRTVSSVGSAFISGALPENSRFAILRTFLRVVGDNLVVPQANTDVKQWPRSYFITAATAVALTLNRPVIGATRKASGAQCFRLVGYTAFQDEVLLPLTVGKGRGYDPSVVTTRDAQITQAAFENLSPIASPWRWRIYSTIPAGSSLALLPTWSRGCKRSTRNAIRGIYSVGEDLFAGAQASLFEADDRWRNSGPTTTLAKSIAIRAGPTQERFPLEADRVVFPDTSLIKIGGTWAIEAGVGYLSIIDAWLKPDGISGIQTVSWCGRLDTNPSLAAGSHGIQFWSRLNDGYPELVVGSSAAGPSRGLFVARGSRRVPASEWTHVRWGVLGVPGGTPALNVPVLWIGGKRVTVTVNATDPGAPGGTWLVQANVQWDAAYALVIGAARDGISVPVVTRIFTATTNASKSPFLPSLVHGFVHSFGGDLAGVVMYREVNGVVASTQADFDPLAISLSNRRFAALETSQASYGVGHKMLDAALPQFGTIYSHPLISLTHAMDGGDEQWSFSGFESDVYCANGGRVGIIDTRDRSFRYAGIQGPRSLPKVEVIRTPLWKANNFITTGDPDNGPVYGVEAIKVAPNPTTTTPAVIAQNYHYQNPRTRVLRQVKDVAMDWGPNKFFVFKCYLRMHSVTGRIQIFGRRDSTSSGVFLEIRDGYLYAGWWDSDLKKEVSVHTSIPVIEPGYVYYIYYRKWFPRGGLAAGHNSQITRIDSNWYNSLHCAVQVGTFRNQACYDALIFRRFTRTAQAEFFDYTGWDAKSYDADTQVIYGGGGGYDYGANGSSARMCVSATSADAELSFDPYTTSMSPTGLVMLPMALNATEGDANGRVQLAAATSQRFLLDHIGMLLQVHGGTLDGQVYRIVEFISAQSVRCIAQDGTAAPFNVLFNGTDTVSVWMGVSLVKSDDYDRSKTPDPGTYAIECFGSGLQDNPLNGIEPFDGEVWGHAYKMVTPTAGDVDGGGNLVCLPDIFETVTAANCPNPPAAGNNMSCAVEAGTDVFGLQGTGNTVIGELPWQGNPAGELQVDTGGFAHTAIDTAPYFDHNVFPYVLSATVPASTKPNAATELALDASASSTDKPVWVELNPVIPGERVARLFFFDPARNRISAPGEQFSISVPDEDDNNPSSSVQLVFSLLPACPDGPGFSTRIYLSQASQSTLFLRAQLDSDQPDSISLEIDEVNSERLGLIDPALCGVPPDAFFVAASQDRMVYGKLPGQADGWMFSLPFFPELVPADNIMAASTGRSAVTAVADFKGAAVVFKRDQVLPYIFDPTTGLPRLQKSGLADGCVSASSIASLEDRLYYVSDRGPQVLLDAWAPFFVGRQMQEFFKTTIDKTQLDRISGTLNRQRTQYVFTVKSLARQRMDERWSLEFQHPQAGMDIERAEMAAGHRSSFCQGPNCTALGSVEPHGGGAPVMVGGTDQGFMVWMDRTDHRTVSKGPVILSGATPMFGGRTFVKGAAALAGDFDRTLEGHMGEVLRAFLLGEKESYVLFSANDGLDRLYLEGPFQEAMVWLNGLGIPQADVVSLGAALWRYSTREIDADTIDLDKLFYFLDISRRSTVGTVKLDCFRNAAPTPVDTKDVDLAQIYVEVGIQSILQQARIGRFLFRTQTPAIDTDVEFLDLVVRLQDNDPR